VLKQSSLGENAHWAFSVAAELRHHPLALPRATLLCSFQMEHLTGLFVPLNLGCEVRSLSSWGAKRRRISLVGWGDCGLFVLAGCGVVVSGMLFG